MDECFRAHVVFETSSDKEARKIEACVIEDNECETYMVEVITTNNDAKTEVVMDNKTNNDVYLGPD